MNTDITTRHRILGALWGSAVGDALGVPVEFIDREERRHDPVTSMRAFGTWNQPAGTWSDDSSLLLCSAESLLTKPAFDSDDMGRRFVEWRKAERWTPWGSVFDIGATTNEALMKITRGTTAELAGGIDVTCNGNGSLMRIIPVALHSAALTVPAMLDRVQRASAITHRHVRSQMACGLYSLLTRRLLMGESRPEAWTQAKEDFQRHYTAREWAAEMPTFSELLTADLTKTEEADIISGGYVLHTLTASIWCLLNTCNFSEAVLRAVNLGADTDTTGCVTGGLAGLHYGHGAIPPEWTAVLARKGDLDCLFQEFADHAIPT